MNIKLGFNGKYSHILDSKGRVVIPSKLMETFKTDFGDSEGFILTKGLERCIEAYPFTEWPHYISQIASITQFDRNARQFLRFVHHNSYKVIPDIQNRISLQPDLMEYAGIKDKVLICGNFNKMEIWNEDNWKLIDKNTELNFEVIAEQMAKMTMTQYPLRDTGLFPGGQKGKNE